MLTLLKRVLALATLAFVAMLLLTAAPAFAADDVANDPPSALLDTASWALLAGFLTPLLTSVVQQPKWSARTRTIAGVVVSVIVGVVTLLANGAFNDGAQTVLSVLALVVVTSGATYRTLWRPSGVAGSIEGVTSPGSNGTPRSS